MAREVVRRDSRRLRERETGEEQWPSFKGGEKCFKHHCGETDIHGAKKVLSRLLETFREKRKTSQVSQRGQTT